MKPSPISTSRGSYSWLKSSRYLGKVHEAGLLAWMFGSYLAAEPTAKELVDYVLGYFGAAPSGLFSVLGSHAARALECKFVADSTQVDKNSLFQALTTLQYEWLYDGNLDLDCDRFAHHLTEWLLGYDFNRPHQKLDYLTPIEQIKKELVRIRGLAKVLPIWPARTFPCRQLKSKIFFTL